MQLANRNLQLSFHRRPRIPEGRMADEASALRRQRLGARLRALREAHDMTGDQVGRAIARSASWISRVESGLIALRRRDLQELLDLYDVHDDTVRVELERMATGRQPQGWWSRYRSVVPEPYGTLIGLEAEA